MTQIVARRLRDEILYMDIVRVLPTHGVCHRMGLTMPFLWSVGSLSCEEQNIGIGN